MKLNRGGGYPPLGSSKSKSSYTGRLKVSSKRVLLVGLLFLFVLSGLSATPLKWTWQSDDENIKYYRYQLNSEDANNWTVVDGKTTSITTNSDSLITDFYLQASYDGEVWSDSSKVEYYPTSVKKQNSDIGYVELSWDNDNAYNYFRYQRDGEAEDKWTVTDGKTESAVLPYHKGLNTYYIQSSWDGLLWSDSAVTTYTYEKEPVDIPLSLRLNVAPYSSAV